jgi:D-alanyl-D-alanine carboxypeptidase
MKLRLPALLSLAAALSAVTSTAQEPAPPPAAGTARAIDATVASVYGASQPGAVVLVMKDGRTVLRKAYGMADVELGAALQPDSVLAIASLGKAFTAAAILRLAEEGKLSLQDEVTRFLPQFDPHGARITVEHLLTHTSGISSLTETADLRAAASQEGRLTDVIGDWVRDLPPDAAPDERWAYSNYGYNLLAAIVEQASGTSYPEYLQRALFAPLGMSHTFYEDRRRVIPLRASGYDVTDEGVFNALPSRARLYQPNGSGAWLSTVDDLARWSESLDRASVLSKASIERMFTPHHLKDGTSTRYGYGWDLGEYDGRRVQEHQGGTTGFVSQIVRMPDDGVLVVILSNRNSVSAPLQATAHRVAALAAGRPIPETPAVEVTASTLERLAGTYRGSDLGTCTVAIEKDALVVQVPGLGGLPLVAVGANTFRTPSLTWTFTFDTDEKGRGLSLRVRDWKLDDTAVRVEQARPVQRPVVAAPAADLEACAGEYESLNGVLVKVDRADDHLGVRPFAQARVEVFPVGAFEFTTKEGDVTYRFVRDPAGLVTGYERSTGRTPVPARRIR